MLDRLMRCLELCLGALLLAAIALNFVNVLGRYLAGRTLVGADEVQTYAMVWIAFLGAGVVAWRGEHLRMNVFSSGYPPRLRSGLRWAEVALVLVVVGFAVVQSAHYVISMAQFGAASPMAQMPMWIPHSGVGAGLALLMVAVAWRAFRRQA
jgi:TRAP-type C4-dicarboxylate transport system permease small subunit